MAVNRIPVEGKVQVKREKSGEVVDETEATFPVDMVTEDTRHPLSNVGMRIGRTVKTANYESATVQVSLNVPCEQSEVDDAFDAVESWLHEKMGQAFINLGLVDNDG